SLQPVDCLRVATTGGLEDALLELEDSPFDGSPRQGLPFIHWRLHRRARPSRCRRRDRRAHDVLTPTHWSSSIHRVSSRHIPLIAPPALFERASPGCRYPYLDAGPGRGPWLSETSLRPRLPASSIPVIVRTGSARPVLTFLL